MSFLHLGALGWLFLIPLILILYFMKLKRKEIKVSCSFLWKKVLQEAKVDSFFQKLRNNLLLILQIIFIILLSGALARPFIKSTRSLPPKMIFILDTSASMQTRENRKSRFDMAREKIIELVKGSKKGTFFVLITSTARAHLQTGFTSDASIILNTLKDLRAQDTSTNLEPALQLAASLAKSEEDAQIFLFSDGSDSHFKKVWPRYSSFVYFEPVGQSRRNMGIISFDIQGSRDAFQVFVLVRNFAQSIEKTYLSVLLDGNLKEAKELALRPGEEKSFIFNMKPGKEGKLEARLDIDDDFAIDNAVYGFVAPMRNKSILLISSGNTFLERLLSLLTSYEIRKLKDEPKGADLKNADLVIWDSRMVSKIPEGNIPHIFISCTLPKDLLTTGGKVKSPTALVWDKSHPVNRYIDYANLSITEAQKIESPSWGKPLLKSAETDLVILLEKGAHRSIVFAFDPYRSDLFLSPLFPILISNMLDFFLQSRGTNCKKLYRPEESITFDVQKEGSNVKVTLPGGRQKTITMSPESPYFSDTLKTGVYSARIDKNETLYAVNLLDKNESDIEPSKERSTITKAKVASLSPMILELWQPVLFIAALLLLLEWSCYHRRRQ